MRTIAIVNEKGGTGKTTTAVNLASCQALAGSRCLLIDMDPQANTTSGLGADPRQVRGKVHPLLRAPRRPARGEVTGLAEDWIVKLARTGLDVLISTPALQEVERQIASFPDGHQRLTNLVDDLRQHYDLILIDCPPSLGLLTVNALYASDAVIVPIQCEYFAMEGLTRILGLVKRVGKSRDREVALRGFLLTMFEPAHAIHHDVAGEVRRYFNQAVFRTVIPRDVALAEAPSHGLSIVDYSPRSRGAHAYVELSREVLRSA